uniref:Uncharacterized protein n=1 Tax=Ditylenchus dipsaci TaxID=166011 RepID=A0A915DRW2_9BILA
MSTHSSNNLLHSCLKTGGKAMAGSAFELDDHGQKGDHPPALPGSVAPTPRQSRQGGMHLSLVSGEGAHPSGHPTPMYQYTSTRWEKYLRPLPHLQPSSSLPPLISSGAPSLNTSVIRPLPLTAAANATASDEWFNHVTNEAKGLPEMSHSIRKFQFNLDCDGSRKR